MRDPNVNSTTIIAFIFFALLLLFFINLIISKVDDTSKNIDNKLLIFLLNLKSLFVKYINGLDKKQKEIFSVLIGLFILNLIFLFISKSDDYEFRDLFWPIDRGSNLIKDYGMLEFIVYTIIPFFIFFLNNYFNKEKKH